MKKILSIFVSLYLTMNLFASSDNYYDFSSNNVYYVILDDIVEVVPGQYPYGGNITIPNFVIYNGSAYPVTHIATKAFYGSSALKSLSIPASVISMGINVFDNCVGLDSIVVDSSNAYFSSENGVLYNKAKTRLIKYPTSNTATTFTMPSSVTSVDSFAFYESQYLQTVTFSPSVTEIWRSTFWYSPNLTTVNFPSSLQSIGDNAFDICNLKYVKLPASVTKIGSYAFANNPITTANIPAGVTTIGTYAFYKCTSLKDLYAYPETPISLTTQNYVFYNVTTSNCTLHVPAASLSLYKSATVWEDFGSFSTDTVETAISSVTASDVKLNVINGSLVISGLIETYPLRVYNIQGLCVYEGKTGLSTTTIPLPAHGIYVVGVGTQYKKIIY